MPVYYIKKEENPYWINSDTCTENNKEKKKYNWSFPIVMVSISNLIYIVFSQLNYIMADFMVFSNQINVEGSGVKDSEPNRILKKTISILKNSSLLNLVGVILGCLIVLSYIRFFCRQRKAVDLYREQCRLMPISLSLLSILLIIMHHSKMVFPDALIGFMYVAVGAFVGIGNYILLSLLNESYKNSDNRYMKITNLNVGMLLGTGLVGGVIAYLKANVPKKYLSLFILSLNVVFFITIYVFFSSFSKKAVSEYISDEDEVDTEEQKQEQENMLSNTKKKLVVSPPKQSDGEIYYTYVLVVVWYTVVAFLEKAYLMSYGNKLLENTLYTKDYAIFVCTMIGFTLYYIFHTVLKPSMFKVVTGWAWHFVCVILMAVSLMFIKARKFHIIVFGIYAVSKTLAITTIYLIVPILLGEATATPFALGLSIIFSYIAEYVVFEHFYTFITSYFPDNFVYIGVVLLFALLTPVLIQTSNTEDNYLKEVALAKEKQEQKKKKNKQEDSGSSTV